MRETKTGVTFAGLKPAEGFYTGRIPQYSIRTTVAFACWNFYRFLKLKNNGKCQRAKAMAHADDITWQNVVFTGVFWVVTHL